jgi:hypothetical protein
VWGCRGVQELTLGYLEDRKADLAKGRTDAKPRAASTQATGGTAGVLLCWATRVAGRSRGRLDSGIDGTRGFWRQGQTQGH